MPDNLRANAGDYLIYFIIILSSCFLRFYNIGSIPAWFNDEGENLNIAWNLSNGRLRLFAVEYAFVPRLPLFYVLAGVVVKFLGNRILALRVLGGVYGVLTAVVLYHVGREIQGRRLGLLSSLLFTVYPVALFYNRTGITHNQFMFLSALTVYFTLKYFGDRKNIWFNLTCLSVGLSLISEYTAASNLASILIVFYFYDRGKTVNAFLKTIPLPIMFLLVMLLLKPQYFVGDAIYMLGFNSSSGNLMYRLSAAITPAVYLALVYFMLNLLGGLRDESVLTSAMVLTNISAVFFLFFCSQPSLGFEYFFSVGLIGFFLIENKTRRNIVLTFFSVLWFTLMLSTPNMNRLIPLAPLFSLGLGVFLNNVYFRVNAILKNFASTATATYLAAAIVFIPSTPLAYYSLNEVLYGPYFGVESIGENQAVAGFINSNTEAEDVVLTPPEIAHLMDCKTSYLLQSAAYKGEAVWYYPSMPEERFSFNTSLMNADYVVDENSEMKSLAEKLGPQLYEETIKWPIVYETKNYLVYRNPYKE